MTLLINNILVKDGMTHRLVSHAVVFRGLVLPQGRGEVRVPSKRLRGGLLMDWLWERAACGSIKLFQSRKKKSTQLLTAPSLAHEENYGTVSAAYQAIYYFCLFFLLQLR